MNIFYLDRDIQTCVEYHVDRHCIKMILEYSQLLSTAHRILDGKEDVRLSNTGRRTKTFRMQSIDDDELMYQATHWNHPSSVWTRSNDSCYRYLHQLVSALAKEYTHRYGKVHLSERSGVLDTLTKVPKNISKGKFTEPTPAMPKEFIIAGDSLNSYRQYYVGAKQHLATWKNRNTPDWYTYANN